MDVPELAPVSAGDQSRLALEGGPGCAQSIPGAGGETCLSTQAAPWATDGGLHRGRLHAASLLLQLPHGPLSLSPKIFQKTKCSICTSALELPSVHFLCGHSFHQHCFESYSESGSECPTCLPENRKVMDMIHAQEQKQDLHDQFQHQVGAAPGSGSRQGHQPAPLA